METIRRIIAMLRDALQIGPIVIPGDVVRAQEETRTTRERRTGFDGGEV